MDCPWTWLGFFWSIIVLNIGVCIWLATGHELLLCLFLEACHDQHNLESSMGCQTLSASLQDLHLGSSLGNSITSGCLTPISHHWTVENPSHSTQLPHRVSLALPRGTVITVVTFQGSLNLSGSSGISTPTRDPGHQCVHTLS